MAYRFTDDKGTFELDNINADPYLYFPLCNEAGIMSCITPSLGGDIKLDQNHFIMQPVSVEDLHNNKSTRNFWLRFEDGEMRSVTGVSVWQRAAGRKKNEFPKLRAGLLMHELINEVDHKNERIKAVITSFVPVDATTAEIMRVSLENTGAENVIFDPIAVVPIYGRSAANIRDHRHVTSLLHRISTEKYGVRVKPTLSFDERGHLKNDTGYFVIGSTGKNEAPVAFYPTVGDVIGRSGDFELPMGLIPEETNGCGAGEVRRINEKIDGYGPGEVREGVEAVGGLRFEKTVLAPGERAEYIIFIGAQKDGDTYNDAGSIIERFGDSDKVKKALEENGRFWLEKASSGLPRGNTAIEELLEELGNDREKCVPENSSGITGKSLENYLLWVGAEPVLRRIFGCSFLPYHDYGKGGRGWRDLWQDCLALMLGDPSQVRDLLINNFAGVRADGTNATIIGSKPGEFIADRNGIARVWMDHGVWPWITTALYMELSADTEFLETEQVYFKDMLCCRALDVDRTGDGTLPGTGSTAEKTASDTENIAEKTVSDTEKPVKTTASNVKRESSNILLDRNLQEYRGSILEHIILMHITAACDVGEHGHMLLRGADWNDALDMAPEKGESVAFTMAYAGNMKDIASFLSGKSRKYRILKEIKEMIDELAETVSLNTENEVIVGRKRDILNKYCNLVRHTVSGGKVEITGSELAEKLDLIASSIMDHVRNTEYMTDGEYGWYNGYYDNEGLPVESLADGRLMLTGAVFAIMSGTATDDQIKMMTKTADRYLFREEIGGYRLNTRFENEEEYAHKLGRMFGFAYGSKENGAVFCHMAVMYAYALMQRGFKAQALKVIGSLIKQSLKFETSGIYPGIPEYFDINGRGMYPYLTGAASWLLLFIYKM